MNCSAFRPRWSTVAVSGAMLAALAVVTAPVASASASAPAPASASAAPLPALDPAELRASIAGLPAADVTGALLRITGRAGHWSGTSGVGDLETGQGVPSDAHIRIGSISKVFTATIVLQLAAEHRIDLDKPVQQYLPGVLPAGLPPIEIGQLLNHTSGLPNGVHSPDFGDGSPEWFAANRFKSFTPQQVIDLMTGQPMQFAPGTAQQYNGMSEFSCSCLRPTRRSAGLPDGVEHDRDHHVGTRHQHRVRRAHVARNEHAPAPP